MNHKIILLFLTTVLFSGCTTSTFKKPPYNNPSDDASIKLAEAANSVSHSMLEMARIQKVITPHHHSNRLTIPTIANLQRRASVDWSGPIREITERIASAANFRVRVLGRSPAIPVIISLNCHDKSLADILRNIDYQAGKRASLHVYPGSQIIELRYAPIYP